jgi:hypothetical protein
VKLLNCTDKKTDKLAQYGLVAQGVAVDGELLMPGKEVEIKESDVARVEAEHAHLFAVGALAWTKPQESVRNALVELSAPAPAPEVATEKPKTKGR